jgi:hypothetical protein
MISAKIGRVLLLACTTWSLHAATEPPPAPATQVRIYYMDQSEPAADRRDPVLKARIQTGKTTAHLEVYPGNQSSAISYTGTSPLKLYGAPAGQEENVLATVALPTGATNVLLIAAHEAGRFRFHPLPYTADHIPAGQVLIFNLCPRPLSVTLGRHGATLPAQGNAVLNPAVTELVTAFKVSRESTENTRQVLIETTLPSIRTDQRLIYLLIPDSKAFNTARLIQVDESADGQ